MRLLDDTDDAGPEARTRVLAAIEVAGAAAWQGEDAPTNAAEIEPIRSADDEPRRMPHVGEMFLDFELVGELGRGAFGRVFLARQGGLAGRPIALKVTADSVDEAQTLAQLQHTHIVPVYSVHTVGDLRAVAMPFFGATTLADVLRDRRAMATVPESGSQFISTLRDRRSGVAEASRPASDLLPAPVGPADATPELGRLASSSFVNATLWLGARLAEGLAHAHARRIVHRDLKPANVLLTDDGQPMILDFNLATGPDFAGGRVGGTLPYMAPEQIRAFLNRGGPVDGRADLYALGVILYELLAGRPAFVVDPDAADPARTMLALRERGLSPIPGISPGAAAIVARCVEFDPARRYPTAQALAADIDLHLSDRPALLALNPSRGERLRMWGRRHPRLSSGGTIAAVALALLAGLGLFAAARAGRAADLEALRRADEFFAGRAEAAALLHVGLSGTLDPAEGRARFERLMASYGFGGPGWRDRPDFRRLPADAQSRLRHEAAELAFLASRASPADEARLLPLAEELYAPDPVPKSIAGRAAEARGEAGHGVEVAPSPREAYLVATDLLARGETGEALRWARSAVERDSTLAEAWHVVGAAESLAGRYARAEAAFSTCLALAPKSEAVLLARGTARLKDGRPREALADLDAALDRKPDWPDALHNRALAREAAGDPRGAVADLSRAVKLAPTRTQFLFVRARNLRKVGRPTEADADLKAAMDAEPGDAASFIARGYARIKPDPEKALADFDKALATQPGDRFALTGKAHVLSERLKRPGDGLKALDEALRYNPDLVEAWVGRAVVHARAGRRAEALADVKEALARDRSPLTLFQAASAYAQLPDATAAERDEALSLLAASLRGGFGHDLIADDPDLAPLKAVPGFRLLVEAAKALRPPGPKTP